MDYHHYIRKLAGNDPIILTAAGAVVTNTKKQLLLFRRSQTGVWSLPGGHMNIGESLEETTVRETFEETGITLHSISLIRLVSGKDAVIRDTHGTETYYVTAIYRCTDFSGELRGSAEGEEVGFFDLSEIPQPMSVSVQGAIAYLQKEGD